VRVEATHPESDTGARFVVRVAAYEPPTDAERGDADGRGGDDADDDAPGRGTPDGDESAGGGSTGSRAPSRSPLGIRRRLRGTGRGPSGGTSAAERLGGAGPTDD
jgi:hypothetical protein